MYNTINVDCYSMVGGPDYIFSQTGIVSCVLQANSVNMQTPISPHSQILVRDHLTHSRSGGFIDLVLLHTLLSLQYNI